MILPDPGYNEKSLSRKSPAVSGILFLPVKQERRCHSSWHDVAVMLMRPYPGASADLPYAPFKSRAPLFGLASTGVYQARELPPCWWALTPPFHFCRLAGKSASPKRRVPRRRAVLPASLGFLLFCGTFPRSPGAAVSSQHES